MKYYRILEFQLRLLEQYKNNENYILELSTDNGCSLAFMEYYDENSVDPVVFFIIEDGKMKLDEEEFDEIPQKEQKHWLKHQI